MKYARTLAVVGAFAALGATAAPASAATTIAMTGGSLAPGVDLTIPATIVGSGGSTYDFTFSDSAAVNGLTQMQAALTGATGCGPTNAVCISYSLWSGTPGAGTLLQTSGAPANAPTFSWNFTPGSYYLEITTPVGIKGETLSGGVSTAAVPEPATWAMLMAGFGMAGYALRRRRMNLLAV